MMINIRIGVYYLCVLSMVHFPRVLEAAVLRVRRVDAGWPAKVSDTPRPTATHDGVQAFIYKLIPKVN